MPQLVPVAKAVAAAKIKIMVGTKGTGRNSPKIETRYWAVYSISVVCPKDHAMIKTIMAKIINFTPSYQD